MSGFQLLSVALAAGTFLVLLLTYLRDRPNLKLRATFTGEGDGSHVVKLEVVNVGGKSCCVERAWFVCLSLDNTIDPATAFRDTAENQRLAKESPLVRQPRYFALKSPLEVQAYGVKHVLTSAPVQTSRLPLQESAAYVETTAGRIFKTRFIIEPPNG